MNDPCILHLNTDCPYCHTLVEVIERTDQREPKPTVSSPSETGAAQTDVEQSGSHPNELLREAQQHTGRGDDCGRLARLVVDVLSRPQQEPDMTTESNAQFIERMRRTGPEQRLDIPRLIALAEERVMVEEHKIIVMPTKDGNEWLSWSSSVKNTDACNADLSDAIRMVVQKMLEKRNAQLLPRSKENRDERQ